MAILRSVGVLSAAKMCAVFSAIIGLIYGIFFAPIVGPLAQSMGIPVVGASGGIIPIVGGLIGGAIAGFLVGAIAAIIYNVLATVFGGIRVDLT